MGRKTTVTDCTGLNNNTFELDPTTFVQKDGNILNTDGSIKAKNKGYYGWTMKIVQKMLRHSYDPYFTPGMVTYSFKIGNGTTEYSDQPFSYSGTVYLDINETSDPLKWHLSENPAVVCNSSNKIGEQVVVWKYLGE